MQMLLDKNDATTTVQKYVIPKIEVFFQRTKHCWNELFQNLHTTVYYAYIS